LVKLGAAMMLYTRLKHLEATMANFKRGWGGGGDSPTTCVQLMKKIEWTKEQKWKEIDKKEEQRMSK
jgi:hypothetical protein